MKRLILAVLGGVLLGSGLSVPAHETIRDPVLSMTTMKAMDANGDGKVSKDEFLSYNEKLWRSLKKDSEGRVDLKTPAVPRNTRMNNK